MVGAFGSSMPASSSGSSDSGPPLTVGMSSVDTTLARGTGDVHLVHLERGRLADAVERHRAAELARPGADPSEPAIPARSVAGSGASVLFWSMSLRSNTYR